MILTTASGEFDSFTPLLHFCHAPKFASFSSEKLFMEMADRISEDGFKDVGYEFVCIDVSQSRARNTLFIYTLFIHDDTY